jgi:ABC-2 type transport system permease protein
VTRDIYTVAWKEWLEFRDQLLTLKRGGLSAAIVLVILGIVTPLQMGPLWITSPLMLAYWPLLSSGMVSTLIADAFAGERERHTLETLLATRLSDTSILLGKVAAAILYGLVFTFANILVGVITLSIRHYGDGIQAPELTHIGYMLALVTLACSTLAGIGVFISLRAATVRQAQQTLGIIMMVLFIGPVLLFQFIGNETRLSLAGRLTTLGTGRLVGWASAVLLAASTILILMAMARFKRGKLTLD